MKLITRFELACRSTQELHALYRETYNDLCRCRPHSAEHAPALHRSPISKTRSVRERLDERTRHYNYICRSEMPAAASSSVYMPGYSW